MTLTDYLEHRANVFTPPASPDAPRSLLRRLKAAERLRVDLLHRACAAVANGGELLPPVDAMTVPVWDAWAEALVNLDHKAWCRSLPRIPRRAALPSLALRLLTLIPLED